jgi:hypothetical protein
MTSSHRHLDDDRLMSIALAGGREQDAGALEHLTCCDECEARLRLQVRLLEADRREAGTEVAAAFTPARLAAQRSRIMRRLDGVGRAARVLEFPERSAPTGRGERPALARRWVAAAAAMGLVAGLGSSLLIEQRFARTPVEETTRLVARPLPATDDDLLGDIDQALLELPAPELRAIDALTPASYEVAFPSR